MRKVIQIAAYSDCADDPVSSVIALCDDGTIWRSALVYEWTEWRKLPPIPQTGQLRKVARS